MRTHKSVEVAGVVERGSGSIPTVDLSRSPVADGDDPSTSAGAASDFLDCRNGIAQGIAAAVFGIPAGAPDPDVSVEQFVLEGLFVVPTSSYVAAGEDEGRRLYTHSVEGEAKVAIVVADSSIIAIDAEGRWVIEALLRVSLQSSMRPSMRRCRSTSGLIPMVNECLHR